MSLTLTYSVMRQTYRHVVNSRAAYAPVLEWNGGGRHRSDEESSGNERLFEELHNDRVDLITGWAVV